jgi:hypothetical protein
MQEEAARKVDAALKIDIGGAPARLDRTKCLQTVCKSSKSAPIAATPAKKNPYDLKLGGGRGPVAPPVFKTRSRGSPALCEVTLLAKS